MGGERRGCWICDTGGGGVDLWHKGVVDLWHEGAGWWICGTRRGVEGGRGLDDLEDGGDNHTAGNTKERGHIRPV